MSLTKFDDPQESKNLATLTKGDALDETRHSIYGSAGGGCFGGLEKQLKTNGILPGIDLTGFDQLAPDHSKGIEHLWHQVKGLFGSHGETLGDEIRAKEVEAMKNSSDPKEQANYKNYQEEEKQIEKYKEEVAHWGMQMTLNPGKFPEAPNCPMHDEIQKRALKTEEKIVQDVRSHMTPAERKQVDDDAKKYAEGVEESHKIHNPMGTGEGMAPPPPPSEALEKYWRHISGATEIYTGN
jgi:hypothetical protein